MSIYHLEKDELQPQESDDFLRLFLANQKKIYLFIGTFLHRSSDIDEVLQETSIILWNKFSEFRRDSDFKSWAFGIARLQVFRYIRSRKVASLSFDENLIDVIAETRDDNIEFLEKRREALNSCMKKLSVRDRKLMEECYQSGNLIKQVAEKLSRPINAVYQSISRIRRTLYDCITEATAK
jgi:RNA polymerase sigma-70 factor (ECF subfamily)